MIYDPWDVVAVPFPFTDTNQTKKRPALVINKSNFQKTHGHLVLLMITSAKNSAWPSDISITDLNTAGLSNSSVIRFKMFTLDERLITRKTGKLNDIDKKAVVEHLKDVIDIAL